MTALLLLARHGNTFEKDQTPTWVGARTDLPLTATGRAQSLALAQTLQTRFFPLDGIASGPLARTRTTAEIVAEKAGISITIDPRLTEIDYGLWEGKTNAEITAAYGAQILERWENEDAWPSDMRWSPSENELEIAVRAFLDAMNEALNVPFAHNRLAVTSNGILRLIHRLVAKSSHTKVGTGRYCVLAPTTQGWTIAEWNVQPPAL